MPTTVARDVRASINALSAKVSRKDICAAVAKKNGRLSIPPANGKNIIAALKAKAKGNKTKLR